MDTPLLEHSSYCGDTKKSTEQCANPPIDERSQNVLLHMLGNIAERNIRCLTVKIEKRGDLQKKTRVLIAPMY